MNDLAHIAGTDADPTGPYTGEWRAFSGNAASIARDAP